MRKKLSLNRFQKLNWNQFLNSLRVLHTLWVTLRGQLMTTDTSRKQQILSNGLNLANSSSSPREGLPQDFPVRDICRLANMTTTQFIGGTQVTPAS